MELVLAWFGGIALGLIALYILAPFIIALLLWIFWR